MQLHHTMNTKSKGIETMTEEQKQPAEKKLPQPARITLFSNGNVFAFNEKGESMPYLEGNVFENLLKSMKKDGVLTDETVIEHIQIMPNPIVAEGLSKAVKAFTVQKKAPPAN